MDEKLFAECVKSVRTYKGARMEILLCIVLTLVNLFAMFGDTYFLFSIYISTLFFHSGYLMRAQAIELGDALTGGIYLGVGITLGIIILIVYLILFLLSKKSLGCLIAIAVLFSIDTIFVVIDIISEPSNFIDLIIHGFVLFTIIRGIVSAKKYAAHLPNGVQTTEKDLAVIYEEYKNQNSAPQE